jgi:phospholipid/cholesterol/gamma-HCH transport system substrate-binding protein
LRIRPVSLLGERYVDLLPGTPNAPLMADGGQIGVEATGATVGLDELVNTLDQPTSTSLGLLVNALGVGLDGNGKNAKDAIAALAPALTRTSELTQVLADQNTTLARLVESMEPVASGLATDDGKALDKLVASTEQLLAAAAADDEAFRAMIVQLPATIRAARSTLGKLEATANAATPTLAKLRPTTGQLDELSQELEAFAAVADPALRSSVPVLKKAEALLQAARPVAAALRATGPSARAASTSAQPLSREFAGRFTAVMEFFKGWALTTNGSDGLSHYFRGGLVLSPHTGTGLLPAAAPTGSTKTGAKGTELLPGVTDLLDGVLPGIGGLLSDLTDKDGGVTGLTNIQELDALGFLLGGN